MNDKKNIILLTAIFLIFSVIFWAKTGNPLIDFSRESYIPYQLNNGEKLIKDIILIYGPFGYILNSFLYKIALNLNILFFEAFLISYSTLILFYFILKKISEEKSAFIFSTIFIAISIFSDTIFGFMVPYSFSGLWACFGAYLALFSLLYDKKNILFLSLGLILANKIEFFVPISFVVFAYLIYKKEKFAKNLIYLFAFPIFAYGFLFLNNFDLNLILANFAHIANMMKTHSISVLYKGVGSFFEIEYFKYNLILLASLFFVCFVSYLIYLKNKPKIAYLVLFIGLSFLNLEFALNLSGFLLIILTVYLLFKKSINLNEIILIIFSLILCSKSFFAINSLSYSNFGFVLLIFVLYMKAKEFINPKWLLNFFLIFFIVLFVNKMFFFIKIEKKTVVKTQIGSFSLSETKADLANKLNQFIKKNIKENETFVIIPEGQIFNLIHKKPHKFYNSTFTPLDFETFGEENIARQLSANKIDYVIFFPRGARDYGATAICYDYAVDFCKYVMDNYTKISSFGEFEEVQIFKLKK